MILETSPNMEDARATENKDAKSHEDGGGDLSNVEPRKPNDAELIMTDLDTPAAVVGKYRVCGRLFKALVYQV